MGDLGLDPETAPKLIQVLLYCMAYVFAGAAFIGLSVYIVLVCSEMFFSQPRSKTQRAKVPQSARRAAVAKETRDLSADETPIRAEAECLCEEAVRVPAVPHNAQTQGTLVPVTLENEPNGL